MILTVRGRSGDIISSLEGLETGGGPSGEMGKVVMVRPEEHRFPEQEVSDSLDEPPSGS